MTPENTLQDIAGYTPEQAATVQRMADALAVGWPLTFGQPDQRAYALMVARTCLNAFTAYVNSGIRVDGLAEVGQIIGYSDIANDWEPLRVVAVDLGNPSFWYTLRNLETNEITTSYCNQHGWTYGRPYIQDAL